MVMEAYQWNEYKMPRYQRSFCEWFVKEYLQKEDVAAKVENEKEVQTDADHFDLTKDDVFGEWIDAELKRIFEGCLDAHDMDENAWLEPSAEGKTSEDEAPETHPEDLFDDAEKVEEKKLEELDEKQKMCNHVMKKSRGTNLWFFKEVSSSLSYNWHLFR